jgi:hypothetical protein
LRSSIFLLSILLFSCSPEGLVSVNPTQCHNNPYIDKILDAVRYVESNDGKYVLNINRNKRGKEISRDEGEYQLNNKNMILFANAYNDGRMYNPYNSDVARRIARQLLLDNYNYLYNWYDAIISYNCGIGGFMKGPPDKSIVFAYKVMKAMK